MPGRAWLSVFAVCAVLSAGGVGIAQERGGADRYLIVRYDDYAPINAYPRESTKPVVEKRVFDLFERYHGRVVVAAIPYSIVSDSEPEKNPASTSVSQSWLAERDSAWVRLFREYVAKGTVEPGVHGFEHRRFAAPGHRPGEMRGRPYQWQHDALRLGRDVVSAAVDAPVRVFVPPWNAWDARTARALEELGFQWLSADLYHAELAGEGLRAVPECTEDPREALAWVRSAEAPPGTILVMVTHPFEFEGANGENYFRGMEELLAYVDASPEWACVGLSDLPEATGAQWRERFGRAVTWDRTQQLVQDSWGPPWLFRPRPVLYMPLDWYVGHTWPFQIVVVATMLVSAVVAYVGGWLIGRALKGWRRLQWAAAVLGTAGVLVLIGGAVRILASGYLLRGVRWQAICIAAGGTLALWMALRRRSSAAVVSEQDVPVAAQAAS